MYHITNWTRTLFFFHQPTLITLLVFMVKLEMIEDPFYRYNSNKRKLNLSFFLGFHRQNPYNVSRVWKKTTKKEHSQLTCDLWPMICHLWQKTLTKIKNLIQKKTCSRNTSVLNWAWKFQLKNIIRFKDNSIKIRENGRGIALG